MSWGGAAEWLSPHALAAAGRGNSAETSVPSLSRKNEQRGSSQRCFDSSLSLFVRSGDRPLRGKLEKSRPLISHAFHSLPCMRKYLRPRPTALHRISSPPVPRKIPTRKGPRMPPVQRHLGSDSKGDGRISDDMVKEDDLQHLPALRDDVQQHGNDA
jgi:hypothetical protein